MASMARAPAPDGFQILSLDGGGVKGLFSAAVLAKLEEDCRVHIDLHFDLIAGTSTGGLIALGLGLGMRPREIVEFYVREGPRVFANPFRLRSLRRTCRPKFGSDNLANALQRCFGNRLFGESNKRLVIPAYNLADDDVYIFRTPHHERLKRDHRVEVWRVAMATTAAPTYFAAFRGVDHIPLVDGGVWANNPTMVALVEAGGTMSVPLRGIKVLSLGTTQPVKRGGRRLEAGGLWHWARPSSEVFLRGQALCATNQARHLLGKDNVVRLDPFVPDRAFRMDRLNTDELMALAAHESRKLCPEFEAVFSSHVAAPYHPLHTKETPHVAHSATV
jgi:predicted acylesterase/phospholipase RssA